MGSVTRDIFKAIHEQKSSLYRIQLLGKPRYADLLQIVMSEDSPRERAERFNKYVSEPQNLRALLRVFPVIATTCISARRLGLPEPSFDVTIVDEASQCDTATALVPILRGKSLVLVGDPQQLNPVVTIDKSDNMALRRSYGVGDEYDYIENSVCKTFLACDSVSNEILLHAHYRCDEVDDIYELAQYVGSNGTTHVTPSAVSSRALGVKPYSTQVERAFLETLNHALGAIFVAGTKHVVKHEVPIASVFEDELPKERLFYMGRFDFVVYEVEPDRSKTPVLAIEVDGKEHMSDEAVRARDRQKEGICSRHGFQLIRVENTYARRHQHIKRILVEYFEGK